MAKLGEVESDDDDDENPFNFIVQGRDPPVRWPTKKKVRSSLCCCMGVGVVGSSACDDCPQHDPFW